MGLSAAEWTRLEALFPEVERLPADQRARYLDLHCADAPAVRAEIEAMLAARVTGDSWLGKPVAVIAPPRTDETLPGGTRLGPWSIVGLIGQGGMAEVYAAERADGRYEGQVAIKLLHTHLANPAVRERFAREGWLLGRLAHPLIARLLDAGATETGRPYLVLEYVDGERLDRWCDAQRLGVAERIGLLLQVCEAVAHAHAHLIVHRDLKPSNIFVGERGVKLLDFGIAKLVEDEEAAGATELTMLGGRAFTPGYAAPEQIKGEPVTTATDVYALGVLLYELLTGLSPYGATSNQAQLRRAVLEKEAAAPSAAPLTEAQAQARGATVAGLRKQLAGDLDNIVAKALSKAPGERYPTALALADDLRRHLNSEPIAAKTHSFPYRAGKFLRRHRFAAAASAALIAAVVAGVTATLWQAQRAEAQAASAREHAERAQRTKAFFVSVFQTANPLTRADGAPETVAHALDDALARVDSELADDPALQGDLLDDFGEIKAGLGDLHTAKALFQRALPLKEKSLPPNHPAIANTLINLGAIEAYIADALPGKPFLERAVAILEQHAETEGHALANARMGLAGCYQAMDDFEQVEKLTRQALEYYRQFPGPQEMPLGIALGNMGIAVRRLKREAEAKAYFTEAVAVIERGLGKNSPNLSAPLFNLTQIAIDENDIPAAAALAERNLAVMESNLPTGHRWTVRARSLLGRVRMLQKRPAEGEQMLRAAIEQFRQAPAAVEYGIQFDAYLGLAASREQAGDFVDALALAEEGWRLCAADAKVSEDCPLLEALRTRLKAQGVPVAG